VGRTLRKELLAKCHLVLVFDFEFFSFYLENPGDKSVVPEVGEVGVIAFFPDHGTSGVRAGEGSVGSVGRKNREKNKGGRQEFHRILFEGRASDDVSGKGYKRAAVTVN
jgi:hypothetical protein